jgi:hypothetical protein
MSLLAPTLEAFFAERLAAQRQASHNTVGVYPGTFWLLRFAAMEKGKPPSRLKVPTSTQSSYVPPPVTGPATAPRTPCQYPETGRHQSGNRAPAW